MDEIWWCLHVRQLMPIVFIIIYHANYEIRDPNLERTRVGSVILPTALKLTGLHKIKGGQGAGNETSKGGLSPFPRMTK